MPPEAVPDEVDGVILSPRRKRPRVGFTVAGMSVTEGVLFTVAHRASFELVENLAGPV